MSVKRDRTGVHPELSSMLFQQFNIIDSVYTPEIDHNPVNFYRFFQRHQDRVFGVNDRLVVFYCDFDYYPNLESIPNTLYNIIKSIAYTNVSSDHVIIFSMTYDVEPLVHQLCNQFNISKISTTCTCLWHDFPAVVDSTVDIKHQKTNVFSTAIGVPRTHRQLLLASIFDKKLQSFGTINYRPDFVKPPTLQHRDAGDQQLPNDLTLRTTIPFSRINEELSHTVDSIQLAIQYQEQLKTPIIDIDELSQPNDPSQGHRWCSQYLQHSLVHVINETVGQYPRVAFSEKTWRAIYSQSAFMIVGPQGSLKKLQSFGFRTFDEFWDESYDSQPTMFERIDRLTDSLSELCYQNWNHLFEKIKPTVEYNFETLKQLKPKELERIKDWLSNA